MNTVGTILLTEIPCSLTEVDGINHGLYQTWIYVHFKKLSIAVRVIQKFKTKNLTLVWFGTCSKSLQLFHLATVFPKYIFMSQISSKCTSETSTLIKTIIAIILLSWSPLTRIGQDIFAWSICKLYFHLAEALFLLQGILGITFTLFALN